jgi:conserved hypothetical protein
MGKRFVLEFGLGVDLHGQDVNEAAKKAVKDAVSQSCLCGLSEVLGITDIDKEVDICATVAVSRPEEIIPEEIAACLPVGRVTVKAVKGGMRVSGMYFPKFGDSDESVEAAVAFIEVFV